MFYDQRHNDRSEVNEADPNAIFIVNRLNMSIVSVAHSCIGATVKAEYKVYIII